MVKSFKYLLVFLLLPAYEGLTAATIGLSIHDSTVVQGNLISFPIYADSSLTGQNVTSYQLQISYNTSIFAADTVITTGTMSEVLGSVSYNMSVPGKISIAAAGTVPLGGKGVLVYIRLKAVGSGYSYLSFTDAAHNFLNEGSPLIAGDNGYIITQAAPTITVSPATGTITVGDSLHFTVSGGTAPYTWSITNGTVAAISSSGWLKAFHAGFTKVVAEDAHGMIDTTNGQVEIRAFRLTVQDTSYTQGQTFDLPVYVSNLTGLGVTSGAFDLTFNQDLLSAQGVVQSGTLLSSYQPPAVNNSVSGKVSVSFAGAIPLSGSGVLLFVRFKVSSTLTGSGSITPANSLFNETMPGNSKSGNFSTINLATLYISPNTANVVAGNTLSFTASGGTPAYSWSTTDTTRAMINSSGLLTGLRGGSINVKAMDVYGGSGMSGAIQIYDTKLTIPDTTIGIGDTVDLPVYMSPANSDNPVSSLQAAITYDSSVVQVVEIVSAGTLTEGWSYVPNVSGTKMMFAAAGATQITTPGVVCILRLRVNPWANAGRTSALTLQQFLLNEGSPRPLFDNGAVTSTNISLPATPTLSSPGDGATSVGTTINMKWNSSTGAASYRLQVSTDSDFATTVYNQGGLAALSASVSGLNFLTKYYWRVSATNSVGTSNWSVVWRFTTVISAPPAPVPSSPADGATNVAINPTISWSTVVGATSYRLQVSAASDFGTILLDSSGLATTSVIIGGLANSTKYYWRVNAVNAGGTAPWSNVWSFNTIVASPGTPVLFAPANGETGTAIDPVMAWNSSSGATSYRLQVSTDSTFAATALDSTDITLSSVNLRGLLHSTRYHWRVRASNVGGDSPWSSTWNFTTIVAPPASPTGLSVAAAGFFGTNLSWVDNSMNETGFKIERTPDSSSSWAMIATLGANSTSHSDTGLVDGFRYFYRVYAYNAGGNSSNSNVAVGITMMRSPAGLAANRKSGPKVELTWLDSSASEEGFKIERKTGAGGAYSLIDSVGANVTTFTDSSVTVGQRYYYRVRCYNAYATSSYSNEVNLLITLVVGDRPLIPEKYGISQNYPNPFNPTTTIDYQLPEAAYVELCVFDVTGRLVRTLVSSRQGAGYYTISFDGSSACSGIYFFRIRAGTFVQMRKMVLVK